MKTQRIGITWQITDLHGWGVFGLNVALELALNGPVHPLILSPPYISAPTPRISRLLDPFVKEQEALLKQIDAQQGQVLIKEALLLHSLGNAFMHSPISEKIRGHANIGFIFFEDGRLSETALERARVYDKIVAGSSWNRDLILEHGIENASFVSQGVDLSRFSPRARTGTFGDRFVVFSGGKLELRKGQDLVAAAFRIFHERHPDSILLTNWHNAWPETFSNLTLSPHCDNAPSVNEDRVADFPGWTQGMGIQEGSHMDIGAVPNAHLPQIIAETDVALFPNRCEGGTNLVAMEVMASGIPCILSANSGHLDIISGDNCYVLEKQSVTSPEIDPSGIWHDSDIDEIVERLEQAYTDREDAKRRAEAGVKFMQGLSWSNQTKALIEDLADFM